MKLLTFFIFLCSCSLYASSMNKCYTKQKDIVLEEQNMYVQIDDQWLQVISLKIDDQGFYISEED